MAENSTLLTLDTLEQEGRAAYVILGGEAHSPAAYRSRLSSAWSQALNGGTASESTKSQAYGISAVAYAGSNYRARTVSEVPAMVADPDGNKTAWNPILPFMPQLPTLMWYTEMSLIVWGVAYLRKWWNQFGYPIKLEWIHPDDMVVQTDVKGIPEYYYIDNVRHETYQVIEIRTFDPNRSLNGKSEFEVALSRIITEQNIVRHAGSFFFNAARPDGILVSKNKLSDTARQRAEKQWKAFKGSENEWKTFVSGSEWEWIPITSAPVDLAMPELSADVKRDICTIIQVNPALIGVADVSDPLSAGSTYKEIKRNHVENTTLPRTGWIYQHLNEQWLYTDFDEQDYYSLIIDRESMPILSDVTADRASISLSLTSPSNPIMDYDEARGVMSIKPREPGAYFSRPVAEASGVWRDTGMSLDEFRVMIGLKPRGGFVGALWRLPDGRLIKESDLPLLADKTLIDQAAPSNPFGLGLNYNPALDETANPGIVSLPPDKVRVRTVRNSDAESNGCAVLLSFANNSELAALQTLLRARIDGGESFYWTDPADFHITLLSCERLDPGAERKLYGLMEKAPQVALSFNRVAAFPPKGDGGEIPVYMALQEGTPELADLMAFQAKLYERAAKAGAVLSELSNPETWTPHVTLYYATGEHTPPALEMPISCAPTQYIFSRDAYQVTQTYPAPIPADPVVTRSELATILQDVLAGFSSARRGGLDYVIPAAAPIVRRDALIDFAGYWADNNFILMAQRVASLALQESGFTSASWIPHPGGWRLSLINLTSNPADASRMILNVSLGDTPKIDLTAARFAVHGDAIGIELDTSETLAKVRGALALEIEASGFNADTPDGWTPFVPLGQLDAELTPDNLAALDAASEKLGFPLVLSEVGLFVDGKRRTGWELRAASSAQLQELNNWRRKLTGRRGLAAPFETSALAGTLAESYIRSALAEMDEGETVNDIFARAQKLLIEGLDYADDLDPTPDEYKAYWQRFDELDADLGRDWLDYMQRSAPSILSTLSEATQVETILSQLEAEHERLLAAWVGTEDEPGVITKFALAGMAAGNEALIAETSMNPSDTRATTITGSIDWTLLSQEAINFAKSYSFKLIKGIDRTTQNRVQSAMEQWIKSGEPLAGLTRRLEPVFNDAARAAEIAQTESIRVYNSGAFDRWKQVGVKRAVWRTVRDPKVCPICRPLNGQIGEIDAGWIHPGGNYTDPYDNQLITGELFKGKVYGASAHPRCRCFRRPILEQGTPGKTPDKKPAETVNKTKLGGYRTFDEYMSELQKQLPDMRAELDKIEARRLAGHKKAKAFRTERDALADALDNPAPDSTPESRAAIREKYLDACDKVINEQIRINKKAQTDARKIIEAANPWRGVKAEYEKGTVWHLPQKTERNEAVKWIKANFDGAEYEDSFNVTIKFEMKGNRPSAAPDGRYINMTVDDGASTYIHELGHCIENRHPDIHERCIQFLLKRRGNEQPIRLNDYYASKGITSSYENHEYVYVDNFEHPYEGKVYAKDYPNPAGAQQVKDFRSSEILSMGLERMYKSPSEFFAKDPEYFNLILGIMRRLT